jgi:hypothetical protein
VVSWAVPVRKDGDVLDILGLASYHQEVADLAYNVPNFDVLLQPRLQRRSGHKGSQLPPHFCLNERRVLALLSIEELMGNLSGDDHERSGFCTTPEISN